MKWIRIDNGTGEETEVSEERVRRVVTGDYRDGDALVTSTQKNGGAIRCTFATYEAREI